jgi:hypothetical protein
MRRVTPVLKFLQAWNGRRSYQHEHPPEKRGKLRRRTEIQISGLFLRLPDFADAMTINSSSKAKNVVRQTANSVTIGGK